MNAALNRNKYESTKLANEKAELSLSQCIESENKLVTAHLRKSVQYPTTQIKQYFDSLNVLSKYPFSRYIEQVTKYHKSLLLSSKGNNTCKNLIQLPLPPGMINLGATCYLNSQIQCLTQNIAFQRGVLSWRNESQMKTSLERKAVPDVGINAALINLQKLLAELQHTPKNTIDTTEFASSLNLLESEMQDPNEFSRLLLDRMMDLCPALKRLLKTLFQGEICYSTVCYTCQSIRSRKETIMELSLPIPTNNAQNKKQKSSSSSSAGKKSKINIQSFSIIDCLTEYLKIEELHSENQYHCEKCNKKCNARRSVSFVSLPPVLQIQLNRYIFDIQRNVKRKRLEEATLPHTLNFKVNGKCKEYVLCGVLNHLGTSAYGGHYVAEGMDWTTGVWFEFNDKDVKLLDKGPTGGFKFEVEADNPNEVISKKRKRKEKKGNENAYSMFYVEKTYLGDLVISEVEKRVNYSIEHYDVIESVIECRKEEYKKIKRIQSEYSAHLCQMRNRHERVLSELFTESTPMFLNPNQAGLQWIDGFQLRKFLSCSKYHHHDMDVEVRRLANPIHQSHHMCSHGGMHPRIARRGKLLTKQMCDALTSILVDECKDNLFHYYFSTSPVSTLWCETCAIDYKKEIKQKYDILTALLEIFGKLDSFSNHSSADTDTFIGLYLVSAKFLSDMKRYIMKIIREIIKNPCIQEEGIDKVSFDEILNSKYVLESGGVPIMDPFVNSRITCPHGKLKQINARAVKKVDLETWKNIEFLFPYARSHACSRIIDKRSNSSYSCIECQKEHQYNERFRCWSQLAMNDKNIKLLLKGKFGGQKEIESSSGPLTLYVVHENMLKAWEQAIKFHLGKGDVDEAKNLDIYQLLHQSREYSSVSRRNGFSEHNGDNGGKNTLQNSQMEKANNFNETYFYVCKAHHSTISLPRALLSNDLSHKAGNDCIKKYVHNKETNFLKLLTKSEYNCLMMSLNSYPDYDHNEDEVNRFFCTKVCISAKESDSNKQGRFYSLDPPLCPYCCLLKKQEIGEKDDCNKGINMGNNYVGKNNDHIEKKMMSNNVHMIIEEAPEQEILVYQIESNVNVYVAAEIEAELFNASSLAKNDQSYEKRSSNGTSVRRSTRKRNQKNHTIYKVKMKGSDRIAKLRLLLFEKYNKPILNQQLYLTTYYNPINDGGNIATNLETKSSQYIVSELPISMNGQSFESILQNQVARMKQKTELSKATKANEKFWIYLQYDDESNTKMSKKEKNEIEESMLNSLLVCDEQFSFAGDNEEKMGVKRGTERGFHGTILQPVFSAPSNKDDIPPINPLNAYGRNTSNDLKLASEKKLMEETCCQIGNLNASSENGRTKMMPITID